MSKHNKQKPKVIELAREPPKYSLCNSFPHPTDSEDADFYGWLDKAAQGDVMGMHNLLCQLFNQMKAAKDDLVLAVRKGTLPNSNTEEEVKATLRQMYAHLQRLETRIFKCRDRLEAIRSKPLTLEKEAQKQET